MGFVIAMAGKGGTGKTTLGAFIVRILKEKKLGSVLAIDADPNSNLGEVLGLKPKQTIGSILDDISRHPERVPAGMPKDRFIEYQVHSAILEGEGFDLLTMGRPEGPGCYCYVNNALRSVLAKLIKDYDYVVIDNEAGLEHLSRRTTRSADTLVVVSDGSKVGLRAAQRINELVEELDIKTKKRFLIVNRSERFDKEMAGQTGLEFLGVLGYDADVEKMSLNGDSVFGLSGEAEGIGVLRKLGEQIWLRS